MERLGRRVGTHKVHRALGAIAGTLLLSASPIVSAQTNVNVAPSEAAQRAALSPYRFILQNAKAPARKPQPAAAPAPAPAPAATTAAAVPERSRPAPARAEPATPQPVAEPLTASAPASAAAPAPEPAVAALSRKPVEPPPPKHDIIPIKTDEPHLPAAVLRENPNGTVRVSFDINTDGTVGDVKVVSSNNRALNRPTMDAVHKWKFEPVDDVLTVETEVVYKFDQ